MPETCPHLLSGRAVASILLLLLACVSALAATAPIAHSARLPTAREQRAIKSAALRHCRETQPGGCRWEGGTLVSTTDPRYAWTSSVGNAYDTSGVLRRPSRRGTRWEVVRVAGGGVQDCSYWTSVVPSRVAGDLAVTAQAAPRWDRTRLCGPTPRPLRERGCGTQRRGDRLLRVRAIGMPCRVARAMLRSPTDSSASLRDWRGWAGIGAGCEGAVMRRQDIAVASQLDVQLQTPRVSYGVERGCNS